ncbi:hypothetical protein [Natronosalvus rutilus]|uniref:Uncharacterized protein n=1 Tax=Natronosalvus rutilus TaxID=2953753 RepID=A0A9E7N7J4_9EURY|nr:hypothetical protein [Natronosalvus rutilus]UTF52291.1 hypothetical protein NGM29_10860 [Natronosalvus rutilus]
MVQRSSATDIECEFFAIIDALVEESRRDIVAHPKGLPSMKKLEFTTGLHRTTIYQHVETLIGADIVEVIEFPVGERSKGLPTKFYGITETVRKLFDRNNIFNETH